MSKTSPSYATLEREGRLTARAEAAQASYRSCDLCPHACGVDRTRGALGVCGAPAHPVIASVGAHPGEERVLLGERGSGTIFFSHCALRCVFCQNRDIAHDGLGRRIDSQTLAGHMLALQDANCPNVNLITPTHFVPDILAALAQARRDGLCIPLVYNTSSYECEKTLERLEDVVDIYLADFKFSDDTAAKRYTHSGAADYPTVAKAALKRMYAQVGPLRLDDEGVARRGLMIRHLIMPNDVSGTSRFLEWLKDELSTDVHVNIMAQYQPPWDRRHYPDIDRGITVTEFVDAVEYALELGFSRLDEVTLMQYARVKERM